MKHPKTVIMVTGHSLEPTFAEKETVKQMEPKISQFVGEHLQDRVFLDRFRSSSAKIVPKVTMMTPALAKQIMKDMGIKLESDEACFLAYDILGITANFGAIWEKKPPSDAEQRLAIQQRADTLANYAYDPNRSEAENIEKLDGVLAVLNS